MGWKKRQYGDNFWLIFVAFQCKTEYFNILFRIFSADVNLFFCC